MINLLMGILHSNRMGNGWETFSFIFGPKIFKLNVHRNKSGFSVNLLVLTAK